MKKLLTILIEIAKAIFTAYLEWKSKPKEVTYVEDDKDIRDNLTNDINSQLQSEDYQTPGRAGSGDRGNRNNRDWGVVKGREEDNISGKGQD